MKLVLISKYFLDDYYSTEEVQPVEYSSIEALELVIKNAAQKYKAEWDKYIEEQETRKNLINARKAELDADPKYKDLFAKLPLIKRARMMHCIKTPPGFRDLTWETKKDHIEKEYNELNARFKEYDEQLHFGEQPARPDPIFKIGKTRISLKHYDEDEHKIYSLEEWFERFK